MGVSAKEARKMVAAGEAAVLDLRGDEDWIAGHIPGAFHASEDGVAERLEDLPSERRILIVCEDGKRSAEVAERLGDGEREADSVEGGMGAWLANDLPLQPPDESD